MSAKPMKATFMTGVHYLNHQQYTGANYGGMQMINRRLQFSKSLYSKDLYAHYGCVNAVEFSNDGEWLVSGGDDKRILIWNVDKTLSGKHRPQPKIMKGEHNSNIFCLGFNYSHSKLYSAGNDEQVILHDVNTGEILDVFLHDEAVYGLSVDPLNENIFVSACDDGRVLIWDVRQTYNDAYTLASCSSAYHAVMHNPVEPQYIATANAKDGVCLWDVRKPRVCVIKYGSNISQSAMSVRFNSTGTHILALRRRLPPVMYDVTSGHSAAEFDHPEYYNSCTMKSCCFAGDRDQYVLSGSDDFKLYVWKIPDNLSPRKRALVNKAHFVLRGHRSIVNQVRYNNSYAILASSGVEKIVKIWSSFPFECNDIADGYVSERDLSRKVYSHEEYINLVLESGQFMTHDYSHHSVQEDPRMMAFFDSLVQRDIEGWTSDSSDATDIFTSYEVQTSDSSDSSSSSSDTDDEHPSNDEQVISIRRECQNNECLQPVSLIFTTPSNRNVKSTSEENKDFSIDRISHLIARKRQETKRKSAHSAMSHHNYRNMRRSLKIFKKNRSNIDESKVEKNTNSGIPPSQSELQSLLNDEGQVISVLASKIKDKRKLLCKKRAKINKDAIFVDSSTSDSDEGSPTEGQISNSNSDGQKTVSNLNILNDGQRTLSNTGILSDSQNVTNLSLLNDNQKNVSNSNILNDGQKTVSNSDTLSDDQKTLSKSNVPRDDQNTASNSSASDGQKILENDCSASLENSGENGTVDVNNGANHKDCSNVDSLLSNPSNGLNGNATNSGSIVCFSSKNGKYNNRNYRKRSAEEMDDE